MLADWRTAPIGPQLRAVLGFLQKLTLSPSEIDSSDVTTLLEAGVSEEAIVDAIQVCWIFNLIDRFADAFGLELPEEQVLAARAKLVFESGYALE